MNWVFIPIRFKDDTKWNLNAIWIGEIEIGEVSIINESNPDSDSDPD